MMLKFVFLALCVYGVTANLSGIKAIISNTAGDAIGLSGKVLTAVPLFLSQGLSGTGDWLSGILDKTDTKSADFINAHKWRLDRLNRAILNKNEDVTLRCPQLVRKYGYPMEEYEVKTDDGYLLALFRIPHSPRSPPIPGVVRPVVFLMHGLLNSAADWVIMGPNKGLAYVMADAGYDVWMGNARGNTYSKKHVSKLTTDITFWDFSWDEIGRFDLPAMIDFALDKSGQKNMYYVGYSQGTTSFFVMCSSKPEYNKKIRIMFALAPVAWMSNLVSPMIRLLSPASNAADWVASALGVGEFSPSSTLMTVAGGVLCKDRAITQDICKNSVFITCGFNTNQMNTTMLPVIMGHTPAGASVKQLLHYGQGLVSKDFRRFDHGEIKNKKIYGARVPPSYDLSKVTAPVSLFYSVNDWLSHPIDVTMLSKKLGKMVEMYEIPDKQFQHLDYMYAIDADKLFYSRILTEMPRYV